MIRLIHAQTTPGPIRVDDIDDGLPNKEAYRLGRTANPKAYARDGYANAPKQPCYVPYSHKTPTGSVVPGYINLSQTERVIFSAGQGKILKLAKAGLILQPVSFTAANIVAPLVTAAATVTSNYTITGTTLSSVTPDTTTVTFTQGTGVTVPSPAVWSQAALLAHGTISGTTIAIATSSFGQVPVAGNLVTINANEQNSNTFVCSA
jgi:hypothetical protein